MFERMHCPCCDLEQAVHINRFQLPDRFCRVCMNHQGDDPVRVLRRAENHEALLRARLNAAATAADTAYAARDEYKAKMYHAYNSREKAVRYLARVNDLHTLRPNGTCSCGMKPRCRTAAVIYENWSQNMIIKLEDVEKERQRQELAVRGMGGDQLFDVVWDRPHTEQTHPRPA
jgi:hypothetical protein